MSDGNFAFVSFTNRRKLYNWHGYSGIVRVLGPTATSKGAASSLAKPRRFFPFRSAMLTGEEDSKMPLHYDQWVSMLPTKGACINFRGRSKLVNTLRRQDGDSAIHARL
jgi:hypothetical protein